MISVHSILAATDLTDTDDRVVQSAMRLARAFDAEIHVVHVAPPGTQRTVTKARDRLAEQVHRCTTQVFGADAVEGTRVDTTILFDNPYHGILVHASAVGADVIVLGAHRRGAALARWVAPTAERVVRSADVPCLVVGQDLTMPVRHVGAAVDLTPAARAGAHVLAEWLPVLGTPDDGRLSLVHVTADPDGEAALAAEVERVDTADVSVVGVLRNGTDVVHEVAQWTADTGADLLVVSTEGRRGLRRLWAGSIASTLTVRAACPVLVVPPAFWRRTPLPLSTVATAIGDTPSDEPAQAWAEHLAAETGASLQWMVPGDREEILRQARDREADLLVVRENRTEPFGRLDAGLTEVLEHTPIPVLVLRDLPAQPIRHILVAVDTGEIWYEKLGWAKRLAEPSGARITIYHAINLSVSSQVRREPGGELVSGASVWLHDGVERKVLPAMRTWLWERARLAGLPLDRVDVEVGLQDPWFAIPAVAQRKEADLVIVAAHADDRPGSSTLSRVARATLERGTYSTLVVVDRAKREAAWGLPDVHSARRAATHASS